MALTPEQLIAKAEAKEAQAQAITDPDLRGILFSQAAGYKRLAAKYQREGR